MAVDYKQDFPMLLQRNAQGQTLAYLDNAATTQKPWQVISAVCDYYKRFNANPHRGVYSAAAAVTEAIEKVREKTAGFIGAADAGEIVFTSGTTDAINLVAQSYGERAVNRGDEILISLLEHHSNLLPWQHLARKKGAVLRYLVPDQTGHISLAEVAEKLTDRTKIFAVTQVSNVLGVVNPIKEMAAMAHAKGAAVLVDAAQSVPHLPINVQALDVDFLAFSGHKMLAPAGVGVLYGKHSLLKDMAPVRLGGGIVEEVTQQAVTFMDAPTRFEAGTQNPEGILGLGTAIDYLEALGYGEIQRIENRLTAYARNALEALPGIVLYGPKTGEAQTGILSFNVSQVHPHDTATILASHEVAVRAGHHCAQPLMQHLGASSTCRMSLYFYNTQEDVDRLVQALKTVRGLLGYGDE